MSILRFRSFVLPRLSSLLLLICVQACAAEIPADDVYRVRVQNRTGGLLQVSLDEGRTYSTVGRVSHPANAHITGFWGASYTATSAVAAVAVHGIRIKTGQAALGIGKAQSPLIFSIVPKQFASIPKGYGGHVPRSSAILTNIDAGHSIFRNQSPYVGSPVFVERNHNLEPVPQDYVPAVGDTFVIVVKRPCAMPEWIEFENRAGGKVTACYQEGEAEEIASVVRPVVGVGRYDGTTFTGVGAINTNHGGVITISTAPVMPPETKEGGAVETRGGFMIQPSFHVREQNETAPQVMVVGPIAGSKERIEGTPPLFDGFINLASYPDHPEGSYRAQVRIDGGEWEDVPEMTGKINDAFTPGYLTSYFSRKGKPRNVKEGVTAVRIVFPSYDRKLVRQDLTRECGEFTRRLIAGGMKPRKGMIMLSYSKRVETQSFVTFYVDGSPVHTSNRPPYVHEWNTCSVPNGLHTIEIESAPDTGASPAVETAEVLVVN